MHRLLCKLCQVKHLIHLPSQTSFGQTSLSISYRSKSVLPLVIKTTTPVADDPIEPEIVQSSTLSPLSYGDFLCTITIEGNILDDGTGAISVAPDTEITAPEVPSSTISEVEPPSKPDVPLSEA
ncbi:hypothetical protein AMTR_s00036p00141250 [Amborella trichopoda]|uniref:Uncharacterized protein n=1 Tax=Amborella trichopoda TaxID=13333 RepID=U5D4R4_AMBTC|nr:hypothetical protein AMTR_s00036p00141250 [Amborella trichopoda]